MWSLIAPTDRRLSVPWFEVFRLGIWLRAVRDSIFFPAMPPDVRKVFDLPARLTLNGGYAP